MPLSDAAETAAAFSLQLLHRSDVSRNRHEAMILAARVPRFTSMNEGKTIRYYERKLI